MAIALLTNYLTDYRVPLFERLAERDGVEVLCFGGDARYVPSWFGDLDAQLERATFPARRIRGPREAFGAGRSYEAVIAPYAGGAILPSAYAGARRHRRPFVLWASVWARPRTPAHLLARPVTDRIYRHADAVVAYGEHVRRFVASIRGHDDDVFVAPQAVEGELFGRSVATGEIEAFRSRFGLPGGPLVLYVGRLVEAKGVRLAAGGVGQGPRRSDARRNRRGAAGRTGHEHSRRAARRPDPPRSAPGRLCGCRADGPPVGPDPALPRAVGARLQRVRCTRGVR